MIAAEDQRGRGRSRRDDGERAAGRSRRRPLRQVLAVALNGAVVRRVEWRSTPLGPGDRCRDRETFFRRLNTLSGQYR